MLILVCCVAVFFLLRNREPSEQERAARRERYRRNRDREHDAAATTTLGISSFGDKLRGMWLKGPSSGSGSGSGGRRGGRGWIQAGSGDEWEINSDRDEEYGAQPMKSFPKPFEETLQETDSPLSDTTSGMETYAPVHYTGSYAKGSSHRASLQQMSFVRSHSPLPLSSSPIPSGSHHQEADIDDGTNEVLPPGHRHFSTQSSTSVRTFEGGTKFIESL